MPNLDTRKNRKADFELAEESPPRIGELAAGAIALTVWIGVFVAGYLIPTATLRESLLETTELWARKPSAAASSMGTIISAFEGVRPINDHLTVSEYLSYLLLVCVAYTVSNIWFLCLIASFLGCMGRRWSTPFRSMEKPDVFGLREVRRAYTTAMLRGFLVYLLVIAGYLLVLPEPALAQMTPVQYARLAGAVSAFAFVVGWEPESVTKLITTALSASRRTSESRNEDTASQSTLAEITDKRNSVIIPNLAINYIRSAELKKGPVPEAEVIRNLINNKTGITRQIAKNVVEMLVNEEIIIRSRKRKLSINLDLRKPYLDRLDRNTLLDDNSKKKVKATQL